MGIQGLWKMLEANGKNTSLIDLSVNEGPGNVPSGDDVRGYRVGIDVSVWYYQANAHNRQTKNAALASLFKRAAALFSLTTVIPTFVFDGSGRPSIKRKIIVRSNKHFLNADFKSLIESFGWTYVEAPGEAEAELAWMCADHIIDAVLTEDSDTFVFGAPRVIRIREISDRAIDITVYEDIGLSREQLVFIAVLAGGDYSDGIPGCGVKTASRLALAGFGDDLIPAALNLSRAKFCEFRPTWRQRFQDSLSRQSFTRALAKKIPADFPDYHTICLYLCPLTSRGVKPPPVVCWNSSPRLGELAAFAAKNLSWGSDAAQLFRHFKRNIFTGLAIRELLKIIPSVDGPFPNDICPYSVIVEDSLPQRTQMNIDSRTCISLQITAPLLKEIEESASAVGMKGVLGSTTRYMRGWVHTGLYNLAQPNTTGLYDPVPGPSITEDAHDVKEGMTDAVVMVDATGMVDVAEETQMLDTSLMAVRGGSRKVQGNHMEVIDIDDESDTVQTEVGISRPAEIISLLSDDEEEEEAKASRLVFMEVIDISDDDQ